MILLGKVSNPPREGCVFLGAKAPLGPLHLVKVKDKRKSFKIEYVARLARKLMLLFNISTSCIERVSKVV